MVNLESSQHYDDGFMNNPKNHPAEQEVYEEYICPRCEGRKNYDEDMCESCMIEEETEKADER